MEFRGSDWEEFFKKTRWNTIKKNLRWLNTKLSAEMNFITAKLHPIMRDSLLNVPNLMALHIKANRTGTGHDVLKMHTSVCVCAHVHVG